MNECNPQSYVSVWHNNPNSPESFLGGSVQEQIVTF